MVLIFVDTGLNTLATQGTVDGDAVWVNALRIIGKTPIALLITTLFAMVALGWRRRTKADVETLMNDALAPVCAIILVTGAGGMFGGVLRSSGIGDALSGALSDLGLPLILAAYVIAVVMRVAQGSATVALVSADRLAHLAPAPVVAAASPVPMHSMAARAFAWPPFPSA